MSDRRRKGKGSQEDNTSRSERYDPNAEARKYQQNVDQYPAPVQQDTGYQATYEGGRGYADPVVYSRPLPQLQSYAQAGPAPRSDGAPPIYQGSSAGTGSYSFYSTTTEASAYSGGNYQDENVPDTSFKDPWEAAGLGYQKPQVQNRSFTPTSADYHMLPTYSNTPSPLTSTPAASHQHVMSRFPADILTFREKGELPYGEDDYPANWDSGYNPAFYNNTEQGHVADLWAGVYKNDEEMRICYLFDHVDLYRLMYIVTTLNSTVDCWADDTKCVEMATEILNNVGRPHGFKLVSQLRPVEGFIVGQVGQLFCIMSCRENKNRGAAVARINEWMEVSNKPIKEQEEQARKSRHNTSHRKSSKYKTPSPPRSTPKPCPYLSPKKVLAGLPEAIMHYFKYDYNAALADKRLCWQWKISQFLYREKGTGDRLIWFLPKNFISPPPVPPEARFWSNITAEQADYDEQEYINNDPDESEFLQKRLERLNWGEPSRLNAEDLAREEGRRRRYEEKGRGVNIGAMQPGGSSSKHARPSTDSSSSHKDKTRSHRKRVSK
ncbi:hypothetical protein EAE96_010841 [Botrytis aclada]|nr:hypothetical protein EAE96_010841 [Botrytis aclada]